MAKVRQDAWSHEDDLLLAETVLRHIREGSTQLNAFEEVGDALNRTSAACGFRWNAEVRSKYVDAIELAKRQRKERKRAEAKVKQAQRKQKENASLYSSISNEKQNQLQHLTLERVIHYLQDLNKNYHQSSESLQEAKLLSEENERLQEKIDTLESELSKANKRLKIIEEDYKAFLQIMERARKMTVFEDYGSTKSPIFKMDKNGNLEQLIQDASK